MLPVDDVALAAGIQSRRYKLLPWVVGAMEKRLISVAREREYGVVSSPRSVGWRGTLRIFRRMLAPSDTVPERV